MITRKKIICLVSLFALLIIPNFGCSVFMAAKQPSEKNVDLFKVGTSRSMLLAEFGSPTVSEMRNEKSPKYLNLFRGTAQGLGPVGRFFTVQQML